MSDRVPMTIRGHEQLKEELKHRKSVVRPEVTKEIEVARAHGDLSENAEYHAAKEKQSFNEGRIQELESKLALAEIIDPSRLGGDKVVFGASVRVKDLESDEEKKYMIVGVDEAELKEGKISVTSPVARALIGKRVGDDITVKSPKGERYYELIEIRFD